VIAVKASRYLTHVKRLDEPAEPVSRFLDRASHLGPKLGPVLIQLPPNLRVDPRRLAATLDEFPAAVRVAVELRHESWFCDEVKELLEEREVALCLADSPHRRTPLWRTAPWGYLRMHEGRAAPAPCYGRRALSSWVERLAEGWGSADDVFVYFNNDTNGCAPRDAAMFGRAARRAGLDVGRLPTAGSVRAG
jgi:uncharacterized protein YecE (DUF72 family)